MGAQAHFHEEYQQCGGQCEENRRPCGSLFFRFPGTGQSGQHRPKLLPQGRRPRQSSRPGKQHQAKAPP